jgi:hypothetical protein
LEKGLQIHGRGGKSENHPLWLWARNHMGSQMKTLRTTFLLLPLVSLLIFKANAQFAYVINNGIIAIVYPGYTGPSSVVNILSALQDAQSRRY